MDYDIDYNVTSAMSYLDKQKFLNQLYLQEDFIINDNKKFEDVHKYFQGYYDPYLKDKYINKILSTKTIDAIRRRNERHD